MKTEFTTISTRLPGDLRFVICTRDRPAALGSCIESLCRALREAFPGLVAHCYVFDDSTSPALSAQVQRVVASAAATELRVTIVDRERQHEIRQQLVPLGAESLRMLRSTCRALGEGPWDLAGVRNFAFLLAYCFSGEDDLLVFLDDDILLTSTTYRGRRINVDGALLIRQLVSTTPAGQLAASGATYFGRFDGSVLDHLRFAVDDVRSILCGSISANRSGAQARECLRQLSLFPAELPIRLTLPGTRILDDGPGISGALLATTPASLLSHFLPSCYDEDWIWLTLLGAPGVAIRTAGSGALHAAPPLPPVEGALVDYQNTGEVVYRAVREVVKEAPPGQNALAWCEEGVSTHHFLAARQSLIEDLQFLLENAASIDHLLETRRSSQDEGPLTASLGTAAAGIRCCLEGALDHVRALDCVALYRWFRLYLRQVPAWRALLTECRDIMQPEKNAVP